MGEKIKSALLWMLGAAFLCLFAWVAVDKLDEHGRLPDAPVEVTVAELAAGERLPWVRVRDGVLGCQWATWHRDHEFVPMLSADTGSGQTHVVMVRLDDDQLCATVPLPLEGRLKSPHEAPLEHFRSLVAGDGVILHEEHLLRADPDVPGSVMSTALAMMGAAVLTLVTMIGLAWNRLRRRREELDGGTSGAQSPAAVPGSVDTLESLARGLDVQADDPLLPAGRLHLTERAAKRARRARQVGTPLLALLGVGFFVAGLNSAWGIVRDVRDWERGVGVDAEAKGEVTRYQAVVVGADYRVAYLLPADADDGSKKAGTVHEVEQSYWTLFVGPGETLGGVRAVKGEPDRVVVHSAVDLWPWRTAIPVFWLILAVALVFAARTTWHSADKLARIADDPEEVLFFIGAITEQRVNGATTGYTVDGAADGHAYKLSLSRNQPPDSLLVANRDGAVLGVRQRSAPENITLVHVDLSPFVLPVQEKARVQAVLGARGSPSRVL